MTQTLVPFSPFASHGAPVPPGGARPWGGALTGPSRPRPDRPTDPAEVLRSAVRHAMLRDLRRLGEALREPTDPARQAALQEHLRLLLSELDPGWASGRRLHRAATGWRTDAGRHAVREAVLDIESVLAPPDEDRASDAGDRRAADRMFVPAGRPRVGVTRWRWLLEDLDEPDVTTVRALLTRRHRFALAVGRRRAHRRQRLLWG